MGGASPGSGGATGGRSGGAGGASAGAGGSVSGKGGASSTGGSGGSVEPGQPCTGNCPKGTAQTCFKDCPLGACDNGKFFAPEPCSSLYPPALDDQTIYCAKAQTSSYCFTVIDSILKYYQVECDDGTPTVTLCDGGCGVDSSGKAACGS